MAVTRVEEKEEASMMSESFGDNVGATSAYALMYVKVGEEVASWNTLKGVKSWARETVAKDNMKFQSELQMWEMAHPRAAIEPTAEEKWSRFRREFEEKKNVVALLNDKEDPFHCSNIFAYVSAFGRKRDVFVAVEVFEKVYCESAINCKNEDLVKRVKEIAGVDDFSDMQRMKKMYESYVRALRFVNYGIRRFCADDPFEACQALTIALRDCSDREALGQRAKFEQALLQCCKSATEKAFAMIRANSKAPKDILEYSRQSYAACDSLKMSELEELKGKWVSVLLSDVPEELARLEMFQDFREKVLKGSIDFFLHLTLPTPLLEAEELATELPKSWALFVQRVQHSK